jgi:hypothetical protein
VYCGRAAEEAVRKEEVQRWPLPKETYNTSNETYKLQKETCKTSKQT